MAIERSTSIERRARFDGLNDGDEVAANPYSSDPNKTDTDGNGLSDDSEMAANPFVTNPSDPDTDGDTFSDNLDEPATYSRTAKLN